MLSFLSTYEEEEVVALTGLTSSTLVIIYDKYCGAGTPICKPRYLFWLFQYYKLYPVSRAFRTIHNGQLKSRRNFLDRLHRWQVSFNSTMCTIDTYRCSSSVIDVYGLIVVYRYVSILAIFIGGYR